MKSYETVQISRLFLIYAMSLLFANDLPADAISIDRATHVVF